MKTECYKVIGVMSGTSLDGIDLALIEFKFKNRRWNYHFEATETHPYDTAWKVKLSQADSYNPEQVKVLNEKYTTYLAETITVFIRRNSIKNIDAICSHGHTVFHQPELHYSLQIGNLPQLANLLSKKVICDFRSQDITLGGQGAPLVPIGDQKLFPDYQACINLGGVANISLRKNNRRIAYDICPVNTVLNRYAQKCGEPYDRNGKIAQSGSLNKTLLNKLNSLDFYNKKPPKSLGIEWVKTVVLPVLEEALLPAETILATFTQHIAQQLAASISHFDHGKVLITGGGAFNKYLINSFRSLTKTEVVLPDRQLIDYKEALIFGLLGVLRLRGEDNVLQSVTGASKDHSSGIIYSPAIS